MKRVGARVLSSVLLLSAVVAGAPLAQTPSRTPAGVTAQFSADTVPMGEAFELRVSLPVEPGRVVYFPDTLPANDYVVSLAPVRWSADAGSAGGAQLRLVYPLIPFRSGTVPVPGVDVLTVPATGETGLDSIPGGSVIGPWSEAPLGRSSPAQRTRFARRAVWVTPVFAPRDLVEGIAPRPSEDVVGSSWHWPSLSLALVLSFLLAGIVVSTTSEWRTARRSSGSAPARHPPATLEAARRDAMEELDRLLKAGLHREGRSQELYTRSSHVVRRFLERLDSAWGPDLTSSEVMDRLEALMGPSATRSLAEEMSEAEIVKFGRLRPAAPVAEEHLLTLLGWLRTSGGPR
ncbi:MAG TPA: hypothetical protein VLA09_13990 [Longimicrobiales bacterium]|nr:hypothetical protein [Longimicrobiales bacterium]